MPWVWQNPLEMRWSPPGRRESADLGLSDATPIGVEEQSGRHSQRRDWVPVWDSHSAGGRAECPETQGGCQTFWRVAERGGCNVGIKMQARRLRYGRSPLAAASAAHDRHPVAQASRLLFNPNRGRGIPGCPPPSQSRITQPRLGLIGRAAATQGRRGAPTLGCGTLPRWGRRRGPPICHCPCVVHGLACSPCSEEQPEGWTTYGFGTRFPPRM